MVLIEGTNNSEILNGTAGDDEILALGGDDTILGTTGSDLIDGGDGTDTLDYSSFSSKITLLAQGFINNGGSNSQIIDVEEIIGAAGKANTIDGSAGISGVSFNIDLGENSLIVENIPVLGSQEFVVENFVDVIGSFDDDIIVGNDERNKLRGFKGDDVITGAGGNDAINGNAGNDSLTGSDSDSRGAGERDVLRGAAGVDLFVVGDESGSFYGDNGNQDRAVIKDFSFGEQIQLGANETYDVRTNNFGFRVFLTSDSQNDLVADVRIVAGSVPSADSSTSSVEPSSPVDVILAGVPEGEFTITSGDTIGIFTA